MNNSPALAALVAKIAANFNVPVSPTDDGQIIIPIDHPVSKAFTSGAYGFAGPIVLDFWERSGRDAGKMEVKAFPHGIDHQIARGAGMGDNCILPIMSVSMSRPLPTIVKEISRRILAPAVAPINARFERAKAKADYEQSAVDTAAKIAGALPMVQVAKRQHNDHSTVYFNCNGIYVNARVQGDSVQFDNMGGLTPERFIVMMQALVDTIPADPAEADKVRDMIETDEIRGHTERKDAMNALHAHLLRGIKVERDAAERARENLAEAELRGDKEAYLNVLRLRVRQAEREVAEVYGEEAAGRDDHASKATGGKYS